MNTVGQWIAQHQHLLLAGFGLLAFALLLKCGERKGRMPHLIFFLILFVMAAVIYLAKDDPAIWIPAAIALLTVAAPTALSWKPADQPDGMRQYEEELKTLRQQILDLQASGSMADDKQRQLLEAQLQAVQEHLTDIRESWKEEQQRRKAADEALEQMKCQMPDARIEKAQVSLRQGDTKAAKETFAEVRKQAGKAAALAAHHEGKLAEGEVNYAEAMELYRTAALLEKDNPDYLLAAGKMARKLAEYKQAQEWLERLLELREKEGKNDAGLGDALYELALLHKDLGQYAAAEPLYLRAVAVKEQALGKEHPDVADVLNGLAALYWREGKYAEAEPLYLRALAVKEQAFGKEHPSVAQTLNDLAILYRNQERVAEAESLYLRSLAIREKYLGKEHLDVAESLNNLALLCRKQGRYLEAEPLCLRSLAIKEAVLGKKHPRIAVTINNLAVLYRQQGKFRKSESLSQRDLIITEKAFGKEHPDVAVTLNNLAELYRMQSRYAEAEPLLHRALQIREDKLGKNHTAVATTLHIMADLYRDQGRYAEAEPLYQRALSILQAKLPAGHSRISGCQKDYDEMKEKMAGM
ncbi:MAG: Tetratricopeptide repeat-containing protein [Candidatus Electronema aureum]|uniref:Tetratricopeptide repeat-containing protein n=1 Tax=Candidatus Electronema aureum TaxID=2005002 RepID=A0A521G1U1_9BACT|nr:MAG: Tetratricopeptide repeat-containing protein [Candidatus Electronema aureum]